jgi:tryptophanyl-tRNA synthetase
MVEAGMQLYNLPHSFMTSFFDLTATLLQNVMFAFRHPLVTAKNLEQEIRFFANERVHQMAMEEIYQRPTREAMEIAKLSFTDLGPIISQREETFMAPWAERIPGIGRVVKATGRAWTGFLNLMRADVFDMYYYAAKEAGENVNDVRFLQNLGYLINAATGRGKLPWKLERAMPLLSQGLFSARKLFAVGNMMNPQFYLTANPFVRKQALKIWLAFLTGGMTLLGLAKMAGAEVGTDPTSTDYGKIKIGNTRFNVWGTYQQLAVLFGRMWKGYATSSVTGRKITLGEGYKPLTRKELITRFFETKEHPTLSYIFGLLQGQTAVGLPFNWSAELLDRFIPMVLADAYDLYQEHGPVGLLGTIPVILGVPTQTYGRQVPELKTTPTGQPTIKLKPYPGLAEAAISKLTGQPVSNIPQEKQAGVVAYKQVQDQLRYFSEQRNKILQDIREGNTSVEEGKKALVDLIEENQKALKRILGALKRILGGVPIWVFQPKPAEAAISKLTGQPISNIPQEKQAQVQDQLRYFSEQRNKILQDIREGNISVEEGKKALADLIEENQKALKRILGGVPTGQPTPTVPSTRLAPAAQPLYRVSGKKVKVPAKKKVVYRIKAMEKMPTIPRTTLPKL